MSIALRGYFILRCSRKAYTCRITIETYAIKWQYFLIENSFVFSCFRDVLFLGEVPAAIQQGAKTHLQGTNFLIFILTFIVITHLNSDAVLST